MQSKIADPVQRGDRYNQSTPNTRSIDNDSLRKMSGHCISHTVRKDRDIFDASDREAEYTTVSDMSGSRLRPIDAFETLQGLIPRNDQCPI